MAMTCIVGTWMSDIGDGNHDGKIDLIFGKVQNCLVEITDKDTENILARQWKCLTSFEEKKGNVV